MELWRLPVIQHKKMGSRKSDLEKVKMKRVPNRRAPHGGTGEKEGKGIFEKIGESDLQESLKA